ncbi:MAG: PaaI family thioesterase [Bacteroidota bacterium]
MNYTPQDPNYASRIAESFRKQEFMEYINATLYKTEPGFCEIHIPYNNRLTQQDRFFHAGVIGTIADNAAGYAAYSLMDARSSVLTVEFKLNLLAPANGELLIGRANVLKYGRTLTVCRSDVYIVKDGIEKLCAAAQVTLIELRAARNV